ncbi:uncharacterized protein NPIL_351461 [Nephila pilipes]|uniref:Chitin-binding type-2 domain-containing protein n=1 Tax=Nephila pilipes TaxID=299642 RepID=A0A8X6P5P4_NEPPI|nr:uncharacterized protein NPIL_351461 [Nephila pilipes]
MPKLNTEFLVSDSVSVPFHFRRPSIVCSATHKRHPHETDCSLFYECRQASRFHIRIFVPHLMKCKPGTLYDKQQEQCVDANMAKCENSGNTHKNRDPDHESKDQDHVKATKGLGCPFPYGKYADPLNCTRFINCRCGTPNLHNCPDYTLYDERKEECLDESLVRCGDRPGGIDDEFEEVKEEKKPIRCPCTFGTFAHPNDCSKYIVCTYDRPTVYSCKKSQLFHPYRKRCSPIGEVDCGNRINPDGKRAMQVL